MGRIQHVIRKIKIKSLDMKRIKIFKKHKYNLGKLSLELIVVFLGITAGFFLNNWKMQKQETLLEQKYLSGFLQNINDNIIQLEEEIASDSLWLIRANPILVSFENRTIIIDSAKVAINLINKITKLKTHIGTYEDIINSGNLNIMSDFEIKTQIINYHTNIKGVKLFEDFFYKYYSEIVTPFILSEYNYLNGDFNDIERIKRIKLPNIFTFYYTLINQKKDAYEELLNQSYSLKNEIQNMSLFVMK